MPIKDQPRPPLLVLLVNRITWLSIKVLQKIHRHLRLVYNKVYHYPPLDILRQKQHLSRILNRKFRVSNTIDTRKPIRLLILAQDGTTRPTSSAFIRLLSPLTAQGMRDNVSVRMLNWPCKVTPEITHCIISRTAVGDKPEALRLLEELKKHRIRLILDIDDAFHNLRKQRNVSENIRQKIDTLELLAREADEIWCSTARLQKHYNNYASNAYVVPNSIDSNLWGGTLCNQPEGEKIQIVYMGTATHSEDLALILPVLNALHQEFPETFELTVIGITPDKVPDHTWIKRKYQPRGKSIYPEFVQWFSEQEPFDIGLCPLVDNDFNNAKSDIKCLDYMTVGAHPIVSDVEPYASKELDPYITRCSSADSWRNELSKILGAPKKFRKEHSSQRQAAYKYISEQRSSDATAAFLYQRLVELENR